MAFSDAGTKIGHLSPWETFKACALHNALQTIEGKLQTRACDLLGERVGLKNDIATTRRAHALMPNPIAIAPTFSLQRSRRPRGSNPGGGGGGGAFANPCANPLQTFANPYDFLANPLGGCLWEFENHRKT